MKNYNILGAFIMCAVVAGALSMSPQTTHAASPTITGGSIHIQSNNASSTLATSTNQVAIYFKTSSPITLSAATSTIRIIGGTIASTTISLVAGTTYTYVASTTLTSVNPADGPITFVIYFADNTGLSTTTASATTDGSQVRYDSIAPTVTPSTITSNNSNSTALAKSGDTVTLHFTSTESILAPTVTIGAHTGITATNVSASTTWTASAAIDGTDSDGTLTFSIATPQDLAGNATTSASWLSSTGIRVDETAPVITILGTTPTSVNQNAIYNDAGATASDSYDLEITSSIVTVNPVTSTIPGTYTVTYNVSDAAGNPATAATRAVVVNASDGGGIFGGGPSSIGYVNTTPTVTQTTTSGSNQSNTNTASTGAAHGVAGASTLTKHLQLGSRGAMVSLLQKLLAQDATIYPAGTVSGYFGVLTRKAVQAFQLKYGVATATDAGYGQVGPKTHAALVKVFGN